MLYDTGSVTGGLLMKITYKWIGGNNLRKRTDGEMAKRNGYCNLLLLSTYTCSGFRMGCGYRRFQSFTTRLFGYAFVFQFAFFVYYFLKNIYLEKKLPVFDKKSHFIINLLCNFLPILVAFFLSFSIITQHAIDGEVEDELKGLVLLAYSLFLFFPYVMVIYYFVMAPIHKERKRFQKRYHDKGKGKDNV